MDTSSSKIWQTDQAKQLARVFVEIDTESDMQSFLRDVMTEKEIAEISARLEAARMLNEGKKYTEIIKKTKLSSRTVARISDWRQNGEGGYKTALNLISAHHHAHLPPARAE